MPRKTAVENLLSQRATRKGVLVPLLEDLFQRPVEVETDEDVEFLHDLLKKMVVRQNARGTKPVFSPSQLASCLRYVYLLKHHKDHGIEKSKSVRVEPHFYFFNGNFLHLKWQFALYKLEQAIDDPSVFKLIGVEVPILSKRKDHGGTVDAVVAIYGEIYIIDFKGLNVRTFGEITRGYVPQDYAVQIADYGMLFNSQVKKKIGKITKGLLVVENKGGPEQKRPLALFETEIEIATYLPEVRTRLEVLRENGEKEEIPIPECTSPYTVQFTGCPFRKFCKKEVTEIHRRHKELERRDSANVAVARPSGTARKRRRAVAKD
jgi:hypothetical protein